jgi:hypothetical protein
MIKNKLIVCLDESVIMVLIVVYESNDEASPFTLTLSVFELFGQEPLESLLQLVDLASRQKKRA